ncbi:MAG: hypothetical protein FWC48_00740 [Actinomycetia bacterium]|nr:hypothetical protein [Actinomycetes bacterium]
MRTSSKRELACLALIAIFACALWSMAALAGAAPTTTVSLSTLGNPTGGAPLQGETPFAPSYFGANSVNGKFPSNGNDYVKDGGPATSTTKGLEGRGPHGGYDTTTNKCGVCHSAHNGGSNASATGLTSGAQLLRTGVTGCEYCHVGSTGLFSNATVYKASGGNVSDLGAGNSGHAITGNPVTIPASGKGTITLTCTSCHSVHGAVNNWMPTDFYTDGSHASMDTAKYGYKLLLAAPGGGTPVPNKSAVGIDPTADPAIVNQFALSIWCESCHDKTTSVQTMESANEASNWSRDTTFTASATGGTTHTTGKIATSVSSPNINGPHASTLVGVGTGPLQCYTCHRGGGLSPAVKTGSDAAPSLQLGKLGYEQMTSASCSICHYGTASYAVDPARLNGTSDWPHSSTGDVALLGNWTVDQSDLYNPTPKRITITTANRQEMLCNRCHPVDSKASTSITFIWAIHAYTHGYPTNPLTGSWETSTTVGTLGSTYSPGYSTGTGQ